jgi:hypothetical protein
MPPLDAAAKELIVLHLALRIEVQDEALGRSRFRALQHTAQGYQDVIEPCQGQRSNAAVQQIAPRWPSFSDRLKRTKVPKVSQRI